MSVCCECCALSGGGLCNRLITHPESPTERACVTECNLETSTRRPRHTGAGQEPVRLFASRVRVPFVLPASVSGAFGLAGAYWWTLANSSLYNKTVHINLSSAVETSLVS